MQIPALTLLILLIAGCQVLAQDIRTKGLRRKKLPPISVLKVANSVGASQQLILRGIVRDGETGDPLIGAVVKAEGIDGKPLQGVQTNEMGEYELKLVPSKDFVKLQISYLGFQTYELPIDTLQAKGEVEAVFSLRPATFTVNEVEIQVVSAATKMEQELRRIPSSVSFISRKQFTGFGMISLNDILYSQPGFAHSVDYDRRTVSARGLYEGWNNNHYLLLVDGIPFNDNLYGSAYTWEINPLVYQSSIEVIRGPGSALYGSNATFGVISINTMSPPAENKLYVEGQLRAGNLNTQIADVLFRRRTSTLSYVVAGNYFNTKGNIYSTYDASGRETETGMPRSFLTRDNRNSQYFYAKLQGEGPLAGWSVHFHQQRFSFQTNLGWLFFIPDQPEKMVENRQIAALKYSTPQTDSDSGKKFFQEYLVRYQRHGINWNMRYYIDNVLNNYYPFGASENLKTGAQDIFGRAQWTLKLGNHASVLAGTEHSLFFYNGDQLHSSNIYLDSVGFPPVANGNFVNAGPWLAWIKDRVVWNAAGYVQWISPRIFDKLEFITGIRYDRSTFSFNALDRAPGTLEKKSFQSISPRLGFTYSLNDLVMIKGQVARAFRSPSPTELFAANTLSLASNIRQLKPEIVVTSELGLDYQLSTGIRSRLTLFHLDFKNQIAYSTANANLSTNVYSATNTGAEFELFFKSSRLSGFVNYSYAARLNEKIADSTITLHPRKLTWAPAHLANVQLLCQFDELGISVSGRYQGRVLRRDSDINTFTSLHRSDVVKPWFTTNVRVSYVFYLEFIKTLEIAIQAQNIFNTQGKLIKNYLYPFDYRIEPFQILGSLHFRI